MIKRNIDSSALLLRNPATFAKTIRDGIDNGHVPQTEARFKALSNAPAEVQAAVLKELDALIAKEDAKKYYDALAKLGSKSGSETIVAFVQAQAAKLEAPPEGSSKSVDLRAAVNASKKAVEPKVSDEPLLDGVDKMREDVKTTNAEIKDAVDAPPATEKAIDKKADEALKLVEGKIADATQSVGLALEKLKSKIERLFKLGTPEAVEKGNQGKAALDAIAKKAIGTPFEEELKKLGKLPETPVTPPNVQKPAAGAGPDATLPPGFAAALKPDTLAGMQKAVSQMQSASRSANIMSLINSGMPIESILLAVMLLLFEDSDEKLKQKLKEQTLNKEKADEIRDQITKLKNRDPATMEVLGEEVAALTAEIESAQANVATLTAQRDALVTEGGTDKPAPAPTPAPVEPPPADPIAAQKVAEVETREAVAEDVKQALDDVGDIASNRDDTPVEKKQKQDQAVENREGSGGEVQTTPDAVLAKQKADAQTADKAGKTLDKADATTEAEAQAGKTDADTSSLPQADAKTPPLDVETLRANKLNDLENQLNKSEGSLGQFNFEIQGLMESRKQMLELVSKLLSDISAMISTIIRNI